MTIGLLFAILIIFIIIFTREVIAPASKAHCDRRWQLLASAINGLQLIFALGVGFIFQQWISGHSLLRMPVFVQAHPALGGVCSFFLASFIAYWWHRAMHYSNWLWRIFHQLHHSPPRIEALTAFYAHPFDAAMASLISCVSAYLILGLDAYAAAWGLVWVSAFNFYIHSDSTSPYILAYFVQRPEMHRIHHETGLHQNNYGLPLWDLLFGTWENPVTAPKICGFSDDAHLRVYEMLLGKDVQCDDP